MTSAAKSKLKPIEDQRLNKIVKAVSELTVDDLSSLHAWENLDNLSSNTLFESVEANPDGVFDVGNNQFEAIANVYITLQYGGKSDSTSMSDSYPARVRGKLTSSGTVRIQSIDVDTSSFYK
jgi:hypothetical protein